MSNEELTLYQCDERSSHQDRVSFGNLLRHFLEYVMKILIEYSSPNRSSTTHLCPYRRNGISRNPQFQRHGHKRETLITQRTNQSHWILLRSPFPNTAAIFQHHVFPMSLTIRSTVSYTVPLLPPSHPHSAALSIHVHLPPRLPGQSALSMASGHLRAHNTVVAGCIWPGVVWLSTSTLYDYSVYVYMYVCLPNNPEAPASSCWKWTIKSFAALALQQQQQQLSVVFAIMDRKGMIRCCCWYPVMPFKESPNPTHAASHAANPLGRGLRTCFGMKREDTDTLLARAGVTGYIIYLGLDFLGSASGSMW